MTTLIANIRARIPSADIFGVCQNPEDTLQRHGIRALPINASAIGGHPEKPWDPEAVEKGRLKNAQTYGTSRIREYFKRFPLLVTMVKGLRRKREHWASIFREIASIRHSYRDLKGTDVLIVAGSGPLIDNWGGAWAQPYTFYKWATLASLTGTQFICLSAGAGPIDRWLSRAFLKRGLQKTSYRSFRDQSSAKLIASLGVKGEHPVHPDMGFGLDVGPLIRPWRPPFAEQCRAIVGLGVMAWLDPRYMPQSDPRGFAAYIRKMAGFAAWLLRNNYGIVAVHSDIRFDPQAFADVRDLLRREHNIDYENQLFDRPTEGLSALTSRVSACDFVVATRFHGVILPWLLNKPVVGIAYNQKTVDLMNSMGQGAFCVDYVRFEVEDLADRFRAMESDRDAIQTELTERVAERRIQLSDQYDHILRPFAGKSTSRISGELDKSADGGLPKNRVHFECDRTAG
ncbi:MAG: polysaccharide pyruvyl transferase family protein [Planctomycetes bacterium]|nr:polysaccharide pyruvyl transferase family protein [Planctomycetota bacterium]